MFEPPNNANLCYIVAVMEKQYGTVVKIVLYCKHRTSLPKPHKTNFVVSTTVSMSYHNVNPIKVR